MRKPFYKSCISLFFLLILATSARSQEQQQEQQQQQQQQQTQTQGQAAQPQQSTEQPMQPIPAYHSPLAGLAGGNDQPQETNPEDLTPDTRPLAGAQDLGLGMPRTEHSFWEPSFNVISTFDSNPLSSTGSGGWVAYTNLLASLDIHRVSTASDLSVTYLGGGSVSSDSSLGNTVIQQFGLSDRISLRRNVISIFEDLSYIPEAGFGYGGFGGLSFPGGVDLGLQNGLAPDESIITAQTQRISNSSIIQLDTSLTPRSSLTFMGGYSLLHFFGAGYFDSGDGLFQAGYNYQLTRQDTIAVLDNFSAYRYGELNESINDDRVNFAYARRVTGRLAFQIAGGPEFASIQVPPSASGTGTNPGTGLTSGTKLYWSLHSGLTYGLRRGGLGLSYDHGVNGGSGVFGGAVGDTVSGNVSRQLSSQLQGRFQFGYSRNTGLYTGSQTYSYWFGSGNLYRPLGRSLGVTLAYQVQYQTSNSSFCIGQLCGDSFTRNTISISVGWHEHPLMF